MSAQILSTTSPTSNPVCTLCEVVSWRAGKGQCGETSSFEMSCSFENQVPMQLYNVTGLVGREGLKSKKVVNFKPQMGPFVFPVGLFFSCQYSSMDKWRNCTFDRSSFGAALTVSAQEQTDYAGFKVEGPSSVVTTVTEL